MHFRWLALKNVLLLYLSNFGEISIFLASSDSFNLKNDIIHTFFSLFWLQILNLSASVQNKNTRNGPFPCKRSVLQNPDRERTNQSTGICLRLALPYNNMTYSHVTVEIYNSDNVIIILIFLAAQFLFGMFPIPNSQEIDNISV